MKLICIYQCGFNTPQERLLIKHYRKIHNQKMNHAIAQSRFELLKTLGLINVV